MGSAVTGNLGCVISSCSVIAISLCEAHRQAGPVELGFPTLSAWMAGFWTTRAAFLGLHSRRKKGELLLLTTDRRGKKTNPCSQSLPHSSA